MKTAVRAAVRAKDAVQVFQIILVWRVDPAEFAGAFVDSMWAQRSI
jgi:hypothetical protein